jgi:hypothetical protein
MSQQLGLWRQKQSLTGMLGETVLLSRLAGEGGNGLLWLSRMLQLRMHEAVIALACKSKYACSWLCRHIDVCMHMHQDTSNRSLYSGKEQSQL